VAKPIPINKIIDFASKKSIHINMTKSAHAALRVACVKRSLSVQEVFEEIGQLIGAENPDLVSILEDVAIRKRNKIIRQLSAADADSIFEIIEFNKPLARQK
jgi:translation initiation factor 2 alpha subunit (eIF-2alpha)